MQTNKLMKGAEFESLNKLLLGYLHQSQFVVVIVRHLVHAKQQIHERPKFEFSNKVSPPITVRCCDSVPSSSCKVTSMKGTQIQAITKLGMNLAFRGSLDLFPAFFVKYSNNSFLLLVSDYPIDLTQFEQYSVSIQIFVILPIVSIIF